MKKISFEKLSELVTSKRKEFNFSQIELSRITGIDLKVIDCIEQGQYIPSAKQMEMLLYRLDIDFGEIVEEIIEDTNVFRTIKDEAKSIEEEEGLEKMISMVFCLRKHKNLRRAVD